MNSESTHPIKGMKAALTGAENSLGKVKTDLEALREGVIEAVQEASTALSGNASAGSAA